MIDFKSMPFKKKAEYIWDYYKLHVIAGLAAIFIIVSAVNFYATRINYVFNLTYIGNSTDSGLQNNFEQKLTGLVVDKGTKRDKALLDVLPAGSLNQGSQEMDTQLVQKITTEIAAGDLDIIIADKNNFDNFADSGIFLRLDRIKGINLTGLKYDEIKGSANSGADGVYGIDVDNSKVLKEAGFDTANKIIGIVANTKQRDKALKVLEWIAGN